MNFDNVTTVDVVKWWHLFRFTPELRRSCRWLVFWKESQSSGFAKMAIPIGIHGKRIFSYKVGPYDRFKWRYSPL